MGIFLQRVYDSLGVPSAGRGGGGDGVWGRLINVLLRESERAGGRCGAPPANQ